jgi:uncharacterized OsmC-like protein
MDRDAEIRDKQERVISVFRKKPSTAFSTVTATGRISDGLACTIRQGDHQAVTDMSRVLGGDEAGPTPGFFIRAGLVGCVAIGIKMAAVREGIRIDALDVDVEMDFDDSAMFGMGTNTAAPLETRLIIKIDSPAPAGKIGAMVERALAADPYFLALRDAQNVTAKVVSSAEHQIGR